LKKDEALPWLILQEAIMEILNPLPNIAGLAFGLFSYWVSCLSDWGRSWRLAADGSPLLEGRPITSHQDFSSLSLAVFSSN